MICSNFLSRQKHDDSNAHEIIPISFNILSWLHARYINIDEESSGRYLVQTQSQTKSSGIKVPEIHGIGKGLDPNIQPEKQIVKPMPVTKVKEISQIKPRIGQGRVGLRHKIKTQTSQPIAQTIEKPPSKIVMPSTSKTQDIAMPIPDYTIPSVKPKGDTGTKVIDRKIIQNVSKEIPI